MTYSNILIQLNDPTDTITSANFAKDLKDASKGVNVISTDDDKESNSKINKIINATFYSVIAITMFLCFFSLCASMSSNLYEQRKEVAILRAMGARNGLYDAADWRSAAYVDVILDAWVDMLNKSSDCDFKIEADP